MTATTETSFVYFTKVSRYDVELLRRNCLTDMFIIWYCLDKACPKFFQPIQYTERNMLLLEKRKKFCWFEFCLSNQKCQLCRRKTVVGITETFMSAISTELFCYFSWQQNRFVDPTKLLSLIVWFKWQKQASERPPFENSQNVILKFKLNQNFFSVFNEFYWAASAKKFPLQ